MVDKSYPILESGHEFNSHFGYCHSELATGLLAIDRSSSYDLAYALRTQAKG